MVAEFLYGVISTILAMVGLLIYAYTKLNQYTEVTLEDTVQRIQQRVYHQPKKPPGGATADASSTPPTQQQGVSVVAEEAAKLDPIKLSCHVRLMAFVSPSVAAALDAPAAHSSSGSGSSGPNPQPTDYSRRATPQHLHSGHYRDPSSSSSSSPQGKDALLGNSMQQPSQQPAVMVDRQGRVVMLGTTIFVYETLATTTSATGGPSSTSLGASGGGAAGAGVGGGGLSSSNITAERLLGKISSASIIFEIMEIGLDGVAGLAYDKLASTTASLAATTSSTGTSTTTAGGAATAALSSSNNSSSNNAPETRPELYGVHVLILSCRHESSPSLFTPSTSGTATALLTDCRRLVIRFPTRRELDRWYNVLATTERSYEWRKFLRTLPSMDLFNLVTARIFFENSTGPALSEVIRKKIAKKLRHVNLPRPVHGVIRVAHVKLGGEVPLISNVSHASVSANGEVGFDFDVLYRGGFQAVFVADLLVRALKVPQLLLYVTVLELGGRVHVSLGPPPSNKLWVGFHSPPNIRLEFAQETTTHEGVLSSLLSLLPDMSDLITRIVKVELFEDLLLPNLDDFPLPNVADDSSSSEDEEGEGTAADVAERKRAKRRRALAQQQQEDHEHVTMKDTGDFVLVGKGPAAATTTSPDKQQQGGPAVTPPLRPTAATASVTPSLRPQAAVSPPPPPLHESEKLHFQSSGKLTTGPLDASSSSSVADQVVGGLHRRRPSGAAASTALQGAANMPKTSDDVRSVLMQKAMEVRRSTSNGRSSATTTTTASQGSLQAQWNQPTF